MATFQFFLSRVGLRTYQHLCISVCGPIWRLNPWGIFLSFFIMSHWHKMTICLRITHVYVTTGFMNKKTGNFPVSWHFGAFAYLFFAVENVTVPHLSYFEQHYIPSIRLASYRILRTAASIALLDTILHCCLLQEAFPLYILLLTWPLPDDGWCQQPKHLVVLNKGPVY